MDLLIAATVFGAILILAVMFFGQRSTTSSEQAQEIVRRMGRPEDSGDLDVSRRRRPKATGMTLLFKKINLVRKLEEVMWQAGIYMRVSDIILIMLLLFGAGAAAAEAVWGDTLLAVGSGSGLATLPVLYIRFRRKARIRAFGLQLPFALDLIKSSLEAGHSLIRALQVLVAEFADPMAGEFRTVLEQVRLGLPLSRAMDDMYRRVPEDDLRLLLVAVKVQTEVGSSLAQIVGRLSEVVRTRQRLRMQIKALTAQGRMGGMVVGLLPVLVLAAFSFIQPSYTQLLFHHPTGIKILKAAICLDVMAFISIRKLLQVDY